MKVTDIIMSNKQLISVYDITKRSSFLSLERWIEEVRRYAATNVLLVLVGECQFLLHTYICINIKV